MRPRQVGRRAVLMVVAVMAAVVPGTAVAQAGGQAAPPPGQHCSYHFSTGETRCFTTLAEATASPRDDRGDVIQATLFVDPNYGGGSFTVYGSGMCEKDGVVNFQINLPDDWKDVVSSVQPWGGCWVWLYPEPDLGGERDGPFKENTADVGSMMNDRTRSVGLS